MTSKMVAIAAAVMALASGSAAKAGYIVNVTQSGSNVLATGSGTINTTALTLSASGDHREAEFTSFAPIALFGPASPASDELFSGISGPSSFGAGGVYLANTGTGDIAGIYYSYLVVPQNYISGSTLSSSDTWTGSTFSSLGLTTGTYVWTWGSGANADSFTMNIGTAASVPEPSSLVLMGISGIAGLGYAWRRRRAQVVA